MEKEDRRVQRTRQLLKDALVALIEERGYEAVTVQDILDRANLGRSTFYAHYSDKDALLFSTFEKLQGAFDVHAQGVTPGKAHAANMDLSLTLFRHVEGNRALFKSLMRGKSGDMLREHAYTYLSSELRGHLRLALPAARLKAPETQAAVHFLISAFVSMLTWWLAQDYPRTAADVDALFKRLAMPGFMATIGVDPLSAHSSED